MFKKNNCMFSEWNILYTDMLKFVMKILKEAHGTCE